VTIRRHQCPGGGPGTRLKGLPIIRSPHHLGLGLCAALAALTSSVLLSASATPASATVTADSTPLLTPFGSSITDSGDVSRLSALMGRPLTSVRVFYNGTPAKWTNSATLNSIPADGTAVISFQTGTPEQIQTFLSGHPPTMKCYATYWHEPEDNFTTPAEQAAYRASWQAYAPAIRAAGCIPTLILLKWSLNPKSGWDWRAWYPAGAVDVMAFDAYNGSAKLAVPGYTDPVAFIAPIVAVSQSTGLPWALAEVGSYVVGTAADRAAWAAGVAAEVSQFSVPFADWWDQVGTNHDFSLDGPTATAWTSPN